MPTLPMTFMTYSAPAAPWRKENRLPTLAEIQQLEGWAGLAENPHELEQIAYALSDAALLLLKALKHA